MRFLDVKTDYAFNKVFASKDSAPVLISFLNAILGYEGEHKIVELDIVDPYQIPLLKGMKDTLAQQRLTQHHPNIRYNALFPST